jgi:hypothetical protein
VPVVPLLLAAGVNVRQPRRQRVVPSPLLLLLHLLPVPQANTDLAKASLRETRPTVSDRAAAVLLVMLGGDLAPEV